MAATQNILKLKTDYEAKISGRTKVEQAAAKALWNKVIDGVRTLLVTKLTRLSALKILDTKNIAKARAFASGLTSTTSTYKSNVQKPAKTLLSPSDAKATADLRGTIDGLAKDDDAKANVANNNALRAQVCSEKKDGEILNLQSNISNLDALKF